MLNSKNSFFILSISLFTVLFVFILPSYVFADPILTSFLLNGSSQNITFNPNNGESVSIEAKANIPIKFTRLYICSVDQICNGTSGNYTRYFTQSDILDTVIKSWNGKKTGDTEVVSAGEYKVMVSMTEGLNAPVTEFGQFSIFVDFSDSSNTTSDSDNTNTNTNNNSTSTLVVASENIQATKANTKNVYISTHSGEEDLSNYDEKTTFEISAGRERMAVIGSPIEFDAKYILLQNNQCTPSFKWSFGDGVGALGKNTEHLYKYSGEYQVVLNGTCGEYGSISRTIVKVISPEVTVFRMVDGDITLINMGKIEINIGNWKIRGTQKDFIFPQDTIISAGNKIVISREDLNDGFFVERVSLNNPSGREVSYYDNKKMEQNDLTVISQTKSNQTLVFADGIGVSVSEAEKLIKEYKTKIVLNKQINDSTKKEKETLITKTVDKNEVQITDKSDTIKTADVLDSVNSSSTNGFWYRFINFPINGVKSFAHMFYDF